ncbi:TIGR00375 family protein [bacterium LRH843]|nr:TIGR00375 family protein [bacterium LRH843]
MKKYIMDLHIHIGRTKSGAPVKISAAPSLTMENIIREAINKKGIDIVGVIDCHVAEVLKEIEESVANGEAYEPAGGGIQYPGVTLFLGTEIELSDEEGQGPIHVLAFFPTIEKMRTFSQWIGKRMKNPTLSSQRIYERAKNVQSKVRELDGLFIPAHVFTPFKSLYGKGVKKSLMEILDPDLIDAIEIGLSSDTTMADQLAELHRYPYVTNSDAHSLEKMAREYQIVSMEQPTFDELRLVLQNKYGRGIISNFGLNPLLGKYHQTICGKCSSVVKQVECPECHSTKLIKGVSDRLQELATLTKDLPIRPPYIHQVPLEFIPKLGKKTLEKLRLRFGTDMNIIHNVSEQELGNTVQESIASAILSARAGTLTIHAGGGGTYGKIKGEH